MTDVLDALKQAKHVTIIAHTHPDVDSIGSASALYTYMLQLHKKVTFYCVTKYLDPTLMCIPWTEKIKHIFPKDTDLAISTDCGSKSRLGLTIDTQLINFDHHLSNNLYGAYNIVDVNAISTTQVVFDFFNQNNITINAKMATALYAGLLDDSRSFLSSKVSEKTFKMAVFLCERGADINNITQHISKRMPLSAFRLKAAMMADMQLRNGARVALFQVSLKMLESYGAHHRDCEVALEESLYLPSVEVSLLLCENKDFTIKCSLRSNGDIDVHKIAKLFDGGGHFYSAGFKMKNQNLEDASNLVLKLI